MTSTNNGRAKDRLLGHARALALEAPLCGIPTADEEVANHCIAQSIVALTQRGLSPIHFLERTDYLWDVFTVCREKVEGGYDAAKGNIGNYAWKCARSAALRVLPTYDMTRLYGPCVNVRAPEKVFHGAPADADGETYEYELTRDATGQIRRGVPDEEDIPWEGCDLDAVIAGLDARSQDIIRCYYREDMAPGDIAARLGISRQRVNQLRHKALEEMRLSMTGGEE